MRRFTLLLSMALMVSMLSVQGQELLRQPDLSPDGSQITFSYQGDIWVVSSQGGIARRLTVHESYEGQARWSPNGQQIAFIGNRYGNNDVFVTSPNGELPRRITHHSSSDVQVMWMGNDDLIFTSRRIFAQVERSAEFHRVSAQGGTPMRFMDDMGSTAAISPDGRYMAYDRGGCRISREAYRGPANRDLWLYDRQEDSYIELTSDEGQDIMPRWTADGRLFFLSARDGRYNVYEIDPRAGVQPRQITNFDKEGIRYYDISDDGSTIVVEKGMSILVSSLTRINFRALTVELPKDFKFYPQEKKTITKGLNEYALSPNGKMLAMGSRGELFLKPNDKEKKRAVNLSEHSYRDQNMSWLNDSTALFLSDREGQFDLYLVQSSDADEPNLYKTFKKEIKRLTQTEVDETNFYLSPDGKQIALRRGRGWLGVYDIDAAGNLSNEKVLLDGWDTPSGVSWSPDSKWLAYGLSDLDFNEDIYIHAADNSQAPVNVTLHPRADNSPQWSRDGSKLAFRSVRNNGDADIWFVWLKKADWEKTKRDWEDDDEDTDKSKDKKKDKKDGDKEVEPIVIDFEDIHERLQQVTSMPGNESNLLVGPKGEYFFFTTNGPGRTTGRADRNLMKVKWDGTEMKTFMPKAGVSRLRLAPDGKKMYMLKGGQVASTSLEKAKAEVQGFSAKMTLDHAAEREQMFEEGWRALNAGFYDPEFHGRDFADLKAKFRPIALAASTRQDFATIFNEMLGQLNASHMGFRTSNSSRDEDLQTQRTGLLGVEWKMDNNQFVVSSILADSPADRSDSKLEVGDVLMAINGQALSATDNLYEHLEGTSNERTLLTISRNGNQEEIIIRPSTSLRNQNYEAWVDQRKKLTERYSNGRLGYIHIQGMNWPSFERFERELTASGYGKEGIVIDVRYNGGGWTTDMLMTVLNVRQHAYTVPRGAAESLTENGKFRQHYPYGERLPLSAMTKPSVALCNEASYSNAEIFSHAYKHLGHGTLVGQPTFGAVISTGGHGLIDGSFVRMPFRAWYVSATQENMEGGPAVPDVLVEDTPASKANDEDPQLKKAVEILLGQIK